MSRRKSSDRWLARHFRDEYVKRAHKEGARSRATYKLEEIDRQDRLLRPGLVVVDLGAAPGGWSEYAADRVGAKGRVIALDVLPILPIARVEVLQGDFTENTVLDSLMELVGGQRVDLVLSDMAPNISGIASADQARAIYLAELALDFAGQTLKPGGSLLIKTFQGAGFPELRKRMMERFEHVLSRKPRASRAESREIYLLGKGFRAEK
jgi:23S rRNA (uridine2552-2'-O)-methyltransferase